jgi:trigger factor
MREITGRAAKADDHVLFDLEGFIGEEPYLGGKKTDYFLELGKEMLLPGFDAHIIGLNPGETKEFSLDIAADYGDTQVAGKTIAFKIDFKTIKEKVLPELNDDFAKDVGEYESLDQLKEAARKAISQRKRQQSETRVRDQIFDALIEKNPFTVPQGMIEMQAQNMLREVARMFRQQGLDINEMGQSQAQMLENYRNRLRNVCAQACCLKPWPTRKISRPKMKILTSSMRNWPRCTMKQSKRSRPISTKTSSKRKSWNARLLTSY